MKNNELKRELTFMPAYDHIKDGRGIHCVEARWIIKGPHGAVVFLLFTQWFLPETRERWEKDPTMTAQTLNVLTQPMPADIGFHALEPIDDYLKDYKREECLFNDGKPCYYDGSALNAERYYEILVTQGGDALWNSLEDYYRDTFNVEKS